MDPNGILKCVDGRGSDNKAMAGPKMLGGVYDIANCRGIKTTATVFFFSVKVVKTRSSHDFKKRHVASLHSQFAYLSHVSFS